MENNKDMNVEAYKAKIEEALAILKSAEMERGVCRNTTHSVAILNVSLAIDQLGHARSMLD